MKIKGLKHYCKKYTYQKKSVLPLHLQKTMQVKELGVKFITLFFAIIISSKNCYCSNSGSIQVISH